MNEQTIILAKKIALLDVIIHCQKEINKLEGLEPKEEK